MNRNIESDIRTIQERTAKLDSLERTIFDSLRDSNVSNEQTRNAINNAIPLIVSVENKVSSMGNTLTWILVIVIIILFIVLVALIIWIIVLLVRKNDDDK